MRQILVEHARARNAAKRGGGMAKVYLDETRELSRDRPPDLVALDDALRVSRPNTRAKAKSSS